MTGVRAALRGSGRWAAVRLVARYCPGAGLALAACAVAAAVLPAVVVLASGRAVAEAVALAGVPDADLTGLAASLGVAGAALGLSFVADVAQDAGGTVVSARLGFAVQRRLVACVGEPAGTAHLEAPDVRAGIGDADGSLTLFRPSEAPAMLARVAAARLGGVAACVLVSLASRWWLGAAVALMWLAVRVPLRRAVRANVATFAGSAGVMRRARYFQALSTDADAAQEIRLFGLGGWVADRLVGQWRGAMGSVWALRARLHGAAAAIGVVVLVANVAVFGVVAADVLSGRTGVAAMVVVLPALAMTSGVAGISFDDIAVEWAVTGLPALSRLVRTVRDGAVPLDGGEDPAGRPRDAIVLDGVGFAYPGGPDVLDGLSLTVPAGRSTAVVGENGAGKSTLVALLARAHDPTAGTIRVDGTDLRGLDPRRWQRSVAVIGQRALRVPGTVEDNVLLGDDADGPALRHALDAAGALPVLDAVPDGPATELSVEGTDGTGLSGGQWQRIALARALYAVRRGATVLVLDEPTAALDPRGEAEFHRRFLEITRGLTTVVISHRFSTVRRADAIAVLDGGRCTEHGTHDELVAAGGTYARMFAAQAHRMHAGEPV